MTPPSPIGEVRRIADAVQGRVLFGTYPSGLRLPTEAALAEEFACGRSTVREALRHLADIGLVASRRGSGAHVLDWRREGTPALLPQYVSLGEFDVSPTALAEGLLRIRAVMACEAVRLAALHGTRESLKPAEARLLAGPSLENDPASHTVNELELYRALVQASGMWPAVWMVNAVWAPMTQLNRMFAAALGPVRADYQPTMEKLFVLIRAGKADAAVAFVERWFRRVDAELVLALESIVAPRAPRQNRAPSTKRTPAARKGRP